MRKWGGRATASRRQNKKLNLISISWNHARFHMKHSFKKQQDQLPSENYSTLWSAFSWQNIDCVSPARFLIQSFLFCFTLSLSFPRDLVRVLRFWWNDEKPGVDTALFLLSLLFIYEHALAFNGNAVFFVTMETQMIARTTGGRRQMSTLILHCRVSRLSMLMTFYNCLWMTGSPIRLPFYCSLRIPPVDLIDKGSTATFVCSSVSRLFSTICFFNAGLCGKHVWIDPVVLRAICWGLSTAT